MYFRKTALYVAILVLLTLALALGGGALAQEFPRTVIDGMGTPIRLAEKPARIFSATLATDNILLSIVDPSRVVGISRYAADPTGSYVLDKVQPHMVVVDVLNPEQILLANPDIVLVASWSDQDAVRQLKQLGLNVYTFTQFNTVEDAMDNIRRIGEITGEEAAAKDLIDGFYARYGEIEEKIAGRPAPRVLSLDSWGTTTGRNTSMHDIIEMAGGVNLAAQYGIEGWQPINNEMVIAMNPDVIVTDSGEEFAKKILADPALASVNAVRNGRVYHVPHAGALNHYFILAIEDLARNLHPDAF